VIAPARILAVDPGKSGAWACIEGARGWGEVLDTTDAASLAAAIREQAPQLVAIEVGTGRGGPITSRVAVAGIARAVGVAEGVVVALGFPLVRVAPKDWQAVAFRGHGKPATYADRKRLSLRLARERWPGAGLVKAKDQAIADALWVAALASNGAKA